MCAWKAYEHIDFNFADFQLDEAINSQTPYYIKSVCAAKVRRADTFVLLIGSDMRGSRTQVAVGSRPPLGTSLVGFSNPGCGWFLSTFGNLKARVRRFSVPIRPSASRTERGPRTGR
jgi:hypothetical protein